MTLLERSWLMTLLVFQWHALDRSEQAKYYEMARKEKDLHMQLYPGWSARDNYAAHQKKKKRKKSEPSLTSSENKAMAAGEAVWVLWVWVCDKWWVLSVCMSMSVSVCKIMSVCEYECVCVCMRAWVHECVREREERERECEFCMCVWRVCVHVCMSQLLFHCVCGKGGREVGWGYLLLKLCMS